MYKLTVIIPVYNQEKLIIDALESIPKGVDIIVINDCSTDNTAKSVLEYMEDGHGYITYLSNDTNKGVAYTVNRGLDEVKDGYVVFLGSDDYFYTKELENVMGYMDGTDLIYFNLEINDGTIMEVTPESKTGYCGSVKLMRREFIGNTKNPENIFGADFYFNNQLLAKNPTEIFTGIVAKHYNYPREGSLSDIRKIKG